MDMRTLGKEQHVQRNESRKTTMCGVRLVLHLLDHFISYINVELLCQAPETNIVVNVKYNLKIKNIYIKQRKKETLQCVRKLKKLQSGV